ncbi:MAG TPA: quinone oxidoreductase [Gemmatimonadales bacterium]|nr:quinone oxidoreductase [Gemmatimonadales bacterium]
MKAIQVSAHGGPEVLEFVDVPEPVAGPGQALIRIEASGINFIDVYHRTGLYQLSLPLILGQEGAGKVVEVGLGVTQVKVGDRVAWCDAPGSYAELVAAPADRLVPIPPGLSSTDATALILQGGTAHYLATTTYPLKPGSTCLVHAAAGGTGLLLCQMAHHRGARVIATVSTEAKAALAREAGAADVILYTRQDFVAETKRLTGGAGVDVVYDSVGKTTFDGSLSVLKPRGLMVLFGQSSGPVPPFNPSILNMKGSLYLTRPKLGDYTRSREELVARIGEVFAWAAEGWLKVRIGATWPLAEAQRAHQSLEGRATTGKLLLLP